MSRMAELDAALREAKDETFNDSPTTFGWDDVSYEVDLDREAIRFIAKDAIYVWTMEFPMEAVMEDGKADVEGLMIELQRFLEKVGD